MRPERDFSDAVCQPIDLPGGEHGVLLLHGFTGTAAHMRPLAEALHAAGFTVAAPNLPGHGTQMQDMLQCTWQDWLECAKSACVALKKRCKTVSVAGLSMGGCLTLLLAEQMEVAAIAPISAPMGTKAPLWLSHIAYPFMPTVSWQPRQEPNALDARFDYGYPGFPTKSGTQLHRIIRMARKDLHAVTCPALIIQSRADETISDDSADVIARGVSSARKGILWLEDVPHVVTISREMDRVNQAVVDHFKNAVE